MVRPLVCTYTPTHFGAKDAFTFDGRLYRVNSSYALARILLAAGYHSKDTLTVADRKGRPRLNPRTLEQLAQWEISETAERIVRRRHRPGRFDEIRVKGPQDAPESVGVAAQDDQSEVVRTGNAMAA